VLNDNSKLTFTGTVHIKKEALNSIAHLVNHNLLLNKSASAIANPQLEVYPSEVECTHCAKTIPLPQTQINYLQTRGLSINNAKELLANGFVDEILKIKK
jgi:Fe-S cluster assembly protein SufD